MHSLSTLFSFYCLSGCLLLNFVRGVYSSAAAVSSSFDHLSFSNKTTTTTATTSIRRRNLASGNNNIPDDITVGVYYYPWHSYDFHRGGGYAREELIPQHRPTLGEYDDRDPQVVGQHLKWSRQANVKLWVCSWWGPNRREDRTILGSILPHPELHNHKISLLYESTNRVRDNSYNLVATDATYICETYFHHRNYYKIDGRPVMFIYLARKLDSLGQLSAMTKVFRDNCHGYDPYLIGDQVWNDAPDSNKEYDAFHHLDAVTNYDIYGNMGGAPYVGQARVDRYYDRQERWRKRAWEDNVKYAVAASPGYNDRAVRPWENHTALSRRLTEDSEPGTLFMAQLERAVQLVDPGLDNLLMINSWNEWHEDSQIEPCEGDPTRNPEWVTQGVESVGYGELYLDILKRATCGPSCQAMEPKPTGPKRPRDPIAEDPFNGTPPNNLLVGALYYAWHGNDFHRGSDYLRKKLDVPQGPLLGEYDDSESYVIADHLEWSREANIGLWITRWSGVGSREDQTIKNVVLTHENLGHHKIALMYETYIGADWNHDRVRFDVEYMCRVYFNHPNYYRIQGRPTLFVVLTRKMSFMGLLESYITLIRNTAASFGYDVYLVGDEVWNSPPEKSEIFLPFMLLDAVYNLDVYGNLASEGYAGTDAVDDFYEIQRNWRDEAWSRQCGYIPSVTPGFNNLDRNPLARKLAEEDQPGSLFARSLQRARYLVDSNINNLMVVNSFNHWFEDTQIEPCIGESTTSEGEVTHGLQYDGYDRLYLDMLRAETADSPSEEIDHVSEAFYPLHCNAFYDPSVPCETKWSSTFGEGDIHENEIVIPCGLCVEMDLAGPILALNGGIDIQGILVIPDGQQLTVRTPYVRVQGELVATSTKEIDGIPDIKFIIYEDGSGIEKFQPAYANVHSCGVQRCDPGPQSIIVAGGRLDIHGVPEDTPTWVNLFDVVTEEESPSFPFPLWCPTDGEFIKETFSTPYPSTFGATPGAAVEFVESSLKVKERMAPYHGAVVDLDGVRECLSSEVVYAVTMQLRLNKFGHEGEPTECSESSHDCLHIYSDCMDDEQQFLSTTKFSESESRRFRYGEWETITTEVSFSESELNMSNLYLLLRVAGVSRGVDIELKSFSLKKSPEHACSASPPDCRNLISCNGSADLGTEMPSPVSAKDGSTVQVALEEGDPFWRIQKKETESVVAGIQFDVAAPCLIENAVYRFRMRVRVHGDEVETAAYLGSEAPFTGSARGIKVAKCPLSTGDWVLCEGYVTMPDVNDNVEGVRVYFETVNNPGVDYDIDDVSFEFLYMASPVTKLVVDKDVNNQWGVGAEIMISSYTLKWDGEQVRRISSIEQYGDGLTLIGLNAPISRPPVESSSSRPVEISLLSRNIVFEGSPAEGRFAQGAHLVVYHTPDIEQVIEGVEFRKFGQQGVQGRYPIYFHRSGNVAGSIVSKNTIRESFQSCIVLAGTNNVLVKDNVAYDTVGHCFVLKDGTETGNYFLRNLGAKTRKVGSTIPTLRSFESELGDSPSTFFAANPSNSWLDNVGAGSEGTGITILLQDTVKGLHTDDFLETDPAALPLTQFEGNIAHSNELHGIRVGLPSSYDPRIEQNFELRSPRVYRNVGFGLSLDNTNSVSILKGDFSDNRRHIYVRHSENVLISDTTIVGMSSEVRQIDATQSNAISFCPSRRTLLAGIEFQTFSRSRQGNGLTVENTVMQGFSDVFCKETVFKVDQEVGWGNFDYFSSISGVIIEERAPRLSLCDADQAGIEDFYLIDQDSSLKPTGSEAKGTSAIVSDHPNILKFISDSERNCMYVAEGCYRYCEGACLRSITFSIDPSDTNTYQLRICERGHTDDCIHVDGHGVEKAAHSPRFVQHGLHYRVALPKGRFDAAFLNDQGKVVWPKFVEEEYHSALCDDAVAYGAVWVEEPDPATPLNEHCSQLIQNGDADESDDSHPHWIAGRNGIQVQLDQGIVQDGEPSSAFCEISINDQNQGRLSQAYLLGQYLDARCMVKHERYLVQAWVRVSNQSRIIQFGNEQMKFGLHFVELDGESFNVELEVSDGIVVPGGQDRRAQQNLRSRKDGLQQYNYLRNADGPISTAASWGADVPTEPSESGYRLLHAEFQVTPAMARASSTFFYIQRNPVISDATVCVDGISITPLDSIEI